MKIVIVGPGALGSLLAAFLIRSKEEVWLLDYNKERSQEIAQSGIKVEGVSGNWQVSPKISADINEIGPADLLIISVKSYDTKQAISAIKPLIKEDSAVLTLQNGIGNIEIITEAIGSERVIAGVTNLGATFIKPGFIRHAGKGETAIGRIDGKMTVKMRSIRQIFNKAGLETKISRDIKGLIWSKLIVNSGINALSAIVRLNNGRLTEFEGTKKIMRETVTEAMRIAKRKRIKLLFDDPLAKVEAVAEATGPNISSMLQDVLRKKRTEIDFINGVIVRQGQELGIPVPVNQVLFDLVKTIEAAYKLTSKEDV
ncbi:MAG: 2-dehydropantoate 2-reductase [Candidatus Omnitrophica bacterium]|nr:2-dehydropantoate 2-reductase [Candidatus Omnitrophota bacterium]MDD4982000.1 2-dehydropantoate 2-reductase [Candidatus Omnitrophota bacterium]